MIGNDSESDEALARRLQSQEMGNFARHRHQPDDPQTPSGNEDSTSLNGEVLSTRAVCIIYGPQVLASVIVLSMHWNDPNMCDSEHKWKWWASIYAFRIGAFTTMVYFMNTHRLSLQRHRESNQRLKNFRSGLETFGLVWFVVGNIWLFGDNDICHHLQRSPIYSLCVTLLVLNYILLFLPCIIAILRIPCSGFCKPCLIQLIARLQKPRSSVCAPASVIDMLPEIILDSSHIRGGQDNTCPICLSEKTVGESARVLRCAHMFHKQCVDEWLRVNDSCPTCWMCTEDGPTSGSVGVAGTDTGRAMRIAAGGAGIEMNPMITSTRTLGEVTARGVGGTAYTLVPTDSENIRTESPSHDTVSLV